MEECIEARALKKSTFLSELAVNSSSQHSFVDDLVFANGVITNGDDFSVDGFFDFSNEEDFIIDEEEEEEEGKDSLSTSEEREEEGCDTWQVSCAEESEVLTAADLSVPVDDMENLEWLSQIVDDSASELSLLCPAGNYNLKTGNNYTPKTGTSSSPNRFEPLVHTHTPILCFPLTVPAKARTKRLRTGGRSWSGGSPESSGDCSPTSTLIFLNPAWNRFQAGFENTEYSEEVVKPSTASKRGRKRSPTVDGSGDASSLVQRRCSHCQVQKTPQWRNGPLGPKTLCNACGVRFKSGRLFPEYRPACSPTFLGDVHSNSHRKVLEMRRKKEVITDGPGLVI